MKKYKKRPDGRYCVQLANGYNRETGKPIRKTIYGKTIAELEANVGEFRRQQNMGLITDDKNITVADWAHQWITAYKSDVGEKTLEFYQIAINVHIIPALGNMKLRDVREHHLQKFLNDKAKETYRPANAKREDVPGKPYSKRTLDRIRTTLKAMFKRAASNHLIGENPAQDLTTPGNLKDLVPKRPLTEWERGVMLECAESHCFGPFVLVLYYTGMRRGEALALTVGDIDLKSGIITINKAVGFDRKHKPYLKEPKSKAGNRLIPIMPPLVQTLTQLCKNKLPGTLLFPDINNPAGYKPSGQLASEWDTFMRACNRQAGGTAKLKAFQRITPHYLRHNFATILFDAGVDLKTAQSIMGHNDVSVLMDIYTHLSEEREKISVNNLKSYFKMQSECSQKQNI